MKSRTRLSLLASGAVVLVAAAVAVPSAAFAVDGDRTCTPPKEVTLSSAATGTYGYHHYASTGQLFCFYPDIPGVPYPFQSYGATSSTHWTIWATGSISYANAGCI